MISVTFVIYISANREQHKYKHKTCKLETRDPEFGREHFVEKSKKLIEKQAFRAFSCDTFIPAGYIYSKGEHLGGPF